MLLKKVFNILFFRKYIATRLKSCGERFRIGHSSIIKNPKYVSIGNLFFSGPQFYISTNKFNLIEIGDYVMFGPEVMILGGNHNSKYTLNHMMYNKDDAHEEKRIIIENGVWVGARSVILSGALIGEGSIVGAMSLVNNFIPPYCVAVGNPAKKIKKRFDNEEEIIKLLDNINSKYDFNSLNKIYKDYNIEY